MALRPSMCVMYVRDAELGDHLFIHCALSRQVCSYFMVSLPLTFVMPNSLINLVRQWGGGVSGSR